MASSISIGPVPVTDSVMTNKLMAELNLLLTRVCSIFVICMNNKRLHYNIISTLNIYCLPSSHDRHLCFIHIFSRIWFLPDDDPERAEAHSN
jgi:hypothetical protein